MGYIDQVQNKLENSELKILWKEICDAYVEGLTEQVKLILNEKAKTYIQNSQKTIEAIKRLL